MLKRKKVMAALLIFIMILTLVVAGCSSSTSSTSNNSSGTAVKTINIGWSGPLSGGAAQYGQDTVDGLKMAIDKINSGGGITVAGQKYNFNLVTLDDQYLPNNTATNARRLKQENNCAVIFCPHSGGVFAMQAFNQTDNFLIMAYTSEPKVTTSGNKLTLRIPPPYNIYSEPFSKRVMEKYGKKVALVPGTHQYAKDWGAVFVPTWEKLGGTVVAQDPVDYNKETDFYTYVSKALAAKPDVLFVGGASKPTAMVIKQARQLGFNGGFVVMDQAKLEQMEETVPLTDLNGSVGVTPVYKYPGSDKFVSDFKAAHNNKLPVWEDLWHYEAMLILAKGMEKAQNVTDPAKILEGIKGAAPFEGADFPAKIPGVDANGGFTQNGSGVLVSDGKYGTPFDIEIPKQ